MPNELEKLTVLSKRLSSLLDDPHPGLITWNMQLADVLREIAEYAPALTP